MNEDVKPCPFCGGKGKVSFKDSRFIGQNLKGDKKLAYRVQVICNKCRGRGAPVMTDGLINPHPYISKWGNVYCHASPTLASVRQTEMFEPYVIRAIDAWNRRAT